MIAVALLVIVGVVALTCGIVADSNHADTLTFLGLIVKTTAAQIFLAGAICTWALFAAMWLLSVGIRRSKERGLELRLLKALRTRGLPGMLSPTAGIASPITGVAGLAAASSTSGITDGLGDRTMSAPVPDDPADLAAADSAELADSEPTVDFADLVDLGDLADLGSLSALDRVHGVAEPGLGIRAESGRFYRAAPRPDAAEPLG